MLVTGEMLSNAYIETKWSVESIKLVQLYPLIYKMKMMLSTFMKSLLWYIYISSL